MTFWIIFFVIFYLLYKASPALMWVLLVPFMLVYWFQLLGVAAGELPDDKASRVFVSIFFMMLASIPTLAMIIARDAVRNKD